MEKQLAEHMKDELAYQLAIEFLYRTELFERSLPHTVQHGVVWVQDEFKKKSADYVSDLMGRVSTVGKKKNIDSLAYKQYRSAGLRYSYAKLEEIYKTYNGKYLLGGIKKWK